MLRALAMAAAITVASAAPAWSQDEETLAAGRELTADFQAGRYDALWERMTGEMREALKSQAALEELHDGVTAQFGAEAEILSETATTEGEYRVYVRTAQHKNGPPPIVTQWALDDQDRIAGFFVRAEPQAAESRFLEYETKAGLRLPFNGEWHVFWGGRTLEQNYHAADPGQRFAYDFLIMRDGASHSGDGSKHEDYYCWDEPILAPADGVVAAMVETLPDLPIGEMDPKHPAGNHVVLDLGGGEYAFLAHMREGSIMVEEGDQVLKGAEIGRCGNSGNTSEPHLHIHLQTTPVLGEGEGLPAQFEDYVADGEPVEEGEPVKGQTVSPRE